jgi:hypothetical protein
MSDDIVCRTCNGTGEVTELSWIQHADGYLESAYDTGYIPCPYCRSGLRYKIPKREPTKEEAIRAAEAIQAAIFACEMEAIRQRELEQPKGKFKPYLVR